MRVTDVRLTLCQPNQERFLAHCSVIIDNAFVIHDVKIIDGSRGIFVAMPSHKITGHCAYCNGKNHLLARYCNKCGNRLDPSIHAHAKIYADTVHPVNNIARQEFSEAVLDSYFKAKGILPTGTLSSRAGSNPELIPDGKWNKYEGKGCKANDERFDSDLDFDHT